MPTGYWLIVVLPPGSEVALLESLSALLAHREYAVLHTKGRQEAEHSKFRKITTYFLYFYWLCFEFSFIVTATIIISFVI